ncbi:MAG: precorrin-2 dehydrogenase/sirohydrochlorin ferrochelatase family protein [Acidimicrobiales bacterium]
MPEPLSEPRVPTGPPLFHLALRLDGQRCLVVGGGLVGARKAQALAVCGGVVTVVAPEICPQLEHLGVKIERRPYQPSDLDGCRLAVAATGDAAVDRRVYGDAREKGVLVNAADDPAACEYIVPAVIRAGPVSVAVSTGGLSPYLAGWLKQRIAGELEPEVAELALMVGECRAALRAAGHAPGRADWAGLVDRGLWPLLRAGRRAKADALAKAWTVSELERLSQP